jgi:hypothetical protein
VNAPVALAASCPCDWLLADDAGISNSVLAEWLLLMPSGICTRACSFELAACATTRFNVSGLLFSFTFNADLASQALTENSSLPSSDAAAIQRSAYSDRATELHCSSEVPASILSTNMSDVLTAAVEWPLTLLPQAHEGYAASNESSVLRTAPGAPILNITIVRFYPDELIDCSKVRERPTWP